MILINAGFSSHQVYYEMGIAEVNYHFITAMTLLKRSQQMQASTLMGTVGSFFIGKGEKTIIEMLQEDISELKGITKTITEIKEEKIKKGQQAVNNIFKGMQGLSGIHVAHRTKPN